MTIASSSPFSARNRGEKNWIDRDFPISARNGLLHLLFDAVEKNFVRGWPAIATELRRIARADPYTYSYSSVGSIDRAQIDAKDFLSEIGWERVFDFCERLYSHLACGRSYEGEVVTTREQAQSFFAEEIQRLFEEENLAFEFRDGLVQRRGKRHTIERVSRAEGSLADLRLGAARNHFSKALRYFRDRQKPDPENAVKEAVCAVEAAAKELFPDSKAATLGDFIKWSTGQEQQLLPKTIAQTFTGLYAFRNGGEGVSHGATSGGTVTMELAEYILAIAASQIIFLADLMSADEEPPF
jgi:AbiJ N-terminal domain 4